MWRIVYFLNDTQYNILLFFFLYCIVTQKYNNLYIIFIMFFYFFLKNESINYSLFLPIMWNLNTNLTNGLCLIHPFLVYWLYIYLFLYAFSKYNVFYYWKFTPIIKQLLYINFLALLLGSWWAYQELNWGGWWNWDFVELILFVFFIKLVILNHKLKFARNLYMYMYNFVFFFYLIIFFVFVRWDILNSVHSFNLISVFENYVNYIVVISLIFLSIYLLFLGIMYRQLKINYTYLINNGKLDYINFNLNFIIFSILIFFFFSVWVTLQNQTEQNENVFFLKLILILVFFWTNIHLNKKNFYYNYLLIIFLKNFISLSFFLGINTFIFKKLNWVIKSIHILGFIIILNYIYCIDFQFFLKEDNNPLLLNNIYNLKNNLILIITPFNQVINIINNESTFNTNLLNPIDFFNINSEILSFFTKTRLEFFYLKTYNYFLFVLWIFVFILFLNIWFFSLTRKNIKNYIY